jgi:L-fucose isomerase-like protein
MSKELTTAEKSIEFRKSYYAYLGEDTTEFAKITTAQLACWNFEAITIFKNKYEKYYYKSWFGIDTDLAIIVNAMYRDKLLIKQVTKSIRLVGGTYKLQTFPVYFINSSTPTADFDHFLDVPCIPSQYFKDLGYHRHQDVILESISKELALNLIT